MATLFFVAVVIADVVADVVRAVLGVRVDTITREQADTEAGRGLPWPD